MNLILEKSKFVDYYTYLDPLFEAVPEFVESVYLVSNLETGGGTDSRLADESLVISGHALRDIVVKEKVQFIWAVLSAFDHDPIIPTELPYADGNPDFWRGSPRPQISGAKFEIVCWDSGSTLFIGVDENITAKLRAKYPDILDVDEDNREKRLTRR